MSINMNKMTKETESFSLITDDDLEHLRAMLGQEVRRGVPHIEELNSDAIRHYAYGIGDPNPLWVDGEYARSSVHGDQLAPPTILFATDRILSGYVTGLPGIHAMFAGTDFRWNRRLRRGDRIHAIARLKDLIERPSKFAGRSIQQTYEIHCLDARGETVAVADSWCFRTERDTAKKRGKYGRESRAGVGTWTPEQIAEIGESYRLQDARRRGTHARYVEDVTVADELPPIFKGPYTATTAIAYLLGWGGLYVRAHAHAFELYARHPALAIRNEFGIPEPPERVHWDPDLAQRVGVPGAYDYGPERVSWMGHVVTDWMGDEGFLAQLRVEVRRHNLIGDLVTCMGEVTEVDPSTGEVGLRLEARDHRGNESARGTAVVRLPKRG